MTTANVPAKCPCCNNPWTAASSGEFFHNNKDLPMMQMCAACVVVAEDDADEKPFLREGYGIDPSNADDTRDRHVNFYAWANGRWRARNPIPPGYPSWNTFVALHAQSQEQCRTLLDELSLLMTTTKSTTTTTAVDDDDDGDADEKTKIARYYAAAVDEVAVEAAGLTPLQSCLDWIQESSLSNDDDDADNLARVLGTLAADYGVYALFSMSASPDAHDSDHTICQLAQGGLGLPDRDYYFDDDKRSQREAYVRHVARMLDFARNGDRDDDETTTALARGVFDMETKLAAGHMTRTENRDPHATYNKMTLTELSETCGNGTDLFADFLAVATATAGDDKEKKQKTDLGDVNVRNVRALQVAVEVASETPVRILRAYLQWHVVHSYAAFLSSAVVREDFDFYQTQLAGTKEMKPRWKRAMTMTDQAVGEILGKLYCARHFDQACKTRALNIVQKVRAALEDRLTEVPWITAPSTRQEALLKMSRFRVKIGYPDEWIDYSALQFNETDTLVDMERKARQFAHQRQVKEMNAPTDRKKWFMTPQTVNAYFHPNMNEIVFPAAILQSPFFDPRADDAVNFGAMGAVVGHEMTHGYDDKGRKFNHDGILHDWWTEEDAAEYEKRVQVMVDQANDFKVEGKPVQGRLTSGENIADLGGLRLALRAFKATEQYKKNEKIDGFTPVQRFFLAWAQCWRQNITKERSLQLLTLDPHGPMEMRCNGPLSNMPEFHEAFDVPPGAPMWKDPALRVDIW